MSSYPAWMEEKALAVARRFTQDTEPQRRASLQLAVSEAMEFAAAERRELLARQSNMPEPDRTAAQARLSELEREYGIAGTAQARLTDLFFGEGFRMGGLARQVPEWLPIDSAPVNETVMVWAPTTFSKWNSALPLPGRRFGPTWCALNGDEAIQRVTPTHWMPLLAPPSPTATDVSQYSKPDRAPGEDGFPYG